MVKPDKDVDLLYSNTIIPPEDVGQLAEKAKKHKPEKFPEISSFDDN